LDHRATILLCLNLFESFADFEFSSSVVGNQLEHVGSEPTEVLVYGVTSKDIYRLYNRA